LRAPSSFLRVRCIRLSQNNIGAIEDQDPDDDWKFAPPAKTSPSQDWLDLVSEANSYLSVHLLFTYVFTLLALRFIHKNYTRFIQARQLFSLELVHSIAARTVMITDLPNHLVGEQALAVYFENMELSVESVSVVRQPGSLEELLDKRTQALLKLEHAWVKYIGNPSSVVSYDPSLNVRSDNANGLLIDVGDSGESQPNRVVVPHRSRPTLRPHWFSFKRVDAIEYLQSEYQKLDEMVQKRRRSKFKPTRIAFVTFEKMSSAEIAAQVVHAPYHSQAITHLAPEPRDIVWANMAHSRTSLRFRELLVLGVMGLLFFFWVFPITALASLLSYKEIKKVAPWLGRLIDSSDQLKAIVQNSLPSVAMSSLNALVPFVLECM
jgi:calcium permeable stress-gated cation channel